MPTSVRTRFLLSHRMSTLLHSILNIPGNLFAFSFTPAIALCAHAIRPKHQLASPYFLHSPPHPPQTGSGFLQGALSKIRGDFHITFSLRQGSAADFRSTLSPSHKHSAHRFLRPQGLQISSQLLVSRYLGQVFECQTVPEYDEDSQPESRRFVLF